MGSLARIGWWPRVVAVVAVAAVVAPAVIDRDSHPLSTYPMYAGNRDEVVRLATATGITAEGTRRTLSLRTVGASDDPLIVLARLDQAIAAGQADRLCAEIAARSPGGLVAVEVVTEQHDIVERASGGESLLERTVHARCPVEG